MHPRFLTLPGNAIHDRLAKVITFSGNFAIKVVCTLITFIIGQFICY